MADSLPTLPVNNAMVKSTTNMKFNENSDSKNGGLKMYTSIS